MGGDEVPEADLHAWVRKLEGEWSCVQFASSLQATPNLVLELYRKREKTLSAVAKARMIIATSLVKQRVIPSVAPLQQFLEEVTKESDDWVKLMLSCLGPGKASLGGPLQIDVARERIQAVEATMERLAKLHSDGPPQGLQGAGQFWPWMLPRDCKYFASDLPDMNPGSERESHFAPRRTAHGNPSRPQGGGAGTGDIAPQSSGDGAARSPTPFRGPGMQSGAAAKQVGAKKEGGAAAARRAIQRAAPQKKKPKLMFLDQEEAVRIQRNQKLLGSSKKAP